jgi:diadenosine tetraphosphate (Ap4A) HIT family hydrolase
MPNETVLKFGYPDSCLHDYDHWCVLLRPKQVTAGCMVLACKDDVTSLGDLSAAASQELPLAARQLEGALAASFGPDKVNYLALMMVDPHVHFHVIPRYSRDVQVGATSMRDAGWPKHPDLQAVQDLSAEDNDALASRLRDAWPS